MKTKESEKPIAEVAETFYEQLPRFVDGLMISTEAGELQPVERTLEPDGRGFVLIISPARILAHQDGCDETVEQFRFPGDFEEFLESVLRTLSVPENIGFDREKSQLICSLDQLCFGMSDFKDDDGNEHGDRTGSIESRIENALLTLAGVEYILKRRGIEFYFCPVQEMYRREKDGEIYYLLCFTPFFFGDTDGLFEVLFGDKSVGVVSPV